LCKIYQSNDKIWVIHDKSVVNSEPLVQSNNNKSGAKVQWQPTLNNPSNNNSNNLSVSIKQSNKNNKKWQGGTKHTRDLLPSLVK
jgi:hypothetical protein